MKKKILSMVTATLMLACVLTGCGRKEGGTVATDGSTSVEKVIGALGEAFEGEYDGVTFTYNPTGSGTGITAVAEGRMRYWTSNSSVKDQEVQKGLTGTVLG